MALPDPHAPHPCRVLLVDDDEDLLELVTHSLSEEPGTFEVVTATTGDEAFLRMVDFTPDVVVLDVCLPDMNGIEIMNQIHDIHPRAHIVVLTGHVSAEQREVALRSGAVRFLEKPVVLAGFKRLLLELGQEERDAGGLEGGGMDIMDLVQMMYVCQKSTAIRFVCKRHRGTLRFERGEAVYIDDGSITGPEAFFNMVLLWGEGRFYTLSEESGRYLEPNNATPTASLLMDAAEIRERHHIDPHVETLQETPHAAVPGVIFDVAPPSASVPSASVPSAPMQAAPMQAAPVQAVPLPAPPLPAAPVSAGEVPPDAPTLRLDLPTLKDLLRGLVATEGARMAVILDWDGFVLEGQSRAGRLDMDTLGAVIATGLGSTQMIGRGFQAGATNLAMLEFEKGTVLVQVVGEDGILAVLLEPQANLGLMRYQIKKAAPALAEALRG